MSEVQKTREEPRETLLPEISSWRIDAPLKDSSDLLECFVLSLSSVCEREQELAKDITVEFSNQYHSVASEFFVLFEDWFPDFSVTTHGSYLEHDYHVPFHHLDLPGS